MSERKTLEGVFANEREGFRFHHALQVRFRDCDAMGHVNNAVYFTYLEQARIAYLGELLGEGHDKMSSFILARAECDYRSAALSGESLLVWIRVGSIGRSSFTFDYEIVSRSDGRTVATARTVQVMYDYSAARSFPVPKDLADIFEHFEGRGLVASA